MLAQTLAAQVRQRKSVRSYDGQPLREADRAQLEAFIQQIENPYGIPVRFSLLDPAAHGLTSPVLTGARLYVAATVDKVPHGEEAFGFSFERLVLFAQSLGIGTVWIGGTMDRAAFEKAVGLKEGERMPCVSPLGYPAAKRSLKETVMRKAVRADERKPAEALFFAGKPDTPLVGPLPEPVAEALELVRWAPAAVNKQPWRILAAGNAYHFYEKQDKGFVREATGDLQKVDLGIALCHFMLGPEARQLAPVFSLQDPGLWQAPDVTYIATVTV